jgi:hypothetical protein
MSFFVCKCFPHGKLATKFFFNHFWMLFFFWSFVSNYSFSWQRLKLQWWHSTSSFWCCFGFVVFLILFIFIVNLLYAMITSLWFFYCYILFVKLLLFLFCTCFSSLKWTCCKQQWCLVLMMWNLVSHYPLIKKYISFFCIFC